MKKIGIIIRWVIGAGIFGTLHLVSLMNEWYTSAFSFALGALAVMPITPIQNLLLRWKIKKWIAVVASIILFFVGLFVAPISDMEIESFDLLENMTVSSITTGTQREFSRTSIDKEDDEINATSHTSRTDTSVTTTSDRFSKSSTRGTAGNITESTTRQKTTRTSVNVTSKKTTISTTTTKKTTTTTKRTTVSTTNVFAEEGMVWIPTHGGTKYHTNSGCSNMIDPIQVTKERAFELGYREPCKRCH